ncbi:hypothetical protein C1645_735791 [Glomus cerebriforme]|uniref:C2H2-type domain-containing protein n=1 Tax=Glomus cerebriforme TaxID=658196 RepID=A0A397T9T6_9GLOM|nr:hypothetical protein C1645_735791 [Glomus cerebriforme]
MIRDGYEILNMNINSNFFNSYISNFIKAKNDKVLAISQFHVSINFLLRENELQQNKSQFLDSNIEIEVNNPEIPKDVKNIGEDNSNIITSEHWEQVLNEWNKILIEEEIARMENEETLKDNLNNNMEASFICKWSNAHSIPPRFYTQKELELHVYNDHEDLANLRVFYRGRQIYLCPWESCKKQWNDISQLKEHLRKHTQQMPFKCPICNGSCRFKSFDKLVQHLVFIHSESVVDLTATDDMTKQEKGSLLNNQGDTFEYEDEVENEDYLICKALSNHFDREYIERLKAQYGLEDLDL